MKNPKRLLRPITRSLRGQLMLAATVPVTLLLVVLTVVSVISFTRLTRTLVERRDAELVQLAARQVADGWVDSVQLLHLVASTDVVRSGDENAARRLIGADTALLQRFDRIQMTDAQGQVIVSVGGQPGGYVGDTSFFEGARQRRRAVRSDVYEDEDGSRLITVAVPIYDLSGRFIGCMLGVWDLDGTHLGQPVAGVRVGERGYAYLVDENGTVLYHPDKSLISANAGDHPAVAAVLRGETGARAVNNDGHVTMVGYAPIPIRLSSSLVTDETWGGWALLTSELWEDIIAPLRPYVALMGMLLVLLITLPLTILATSSRRIVAPLQSLVTQVDRVASGEFDTQVSINARALELRELELAFNKMVDQLREYRDDIQSYVVSILNTQEEERKRIARELHDETAQELVVLGRRIEMAAETATDPDLAEDLNRLRDMVDDMVQGVRRFTRDLRPPLLEELGLSRTIEILGNRMAREEPFDVGVRVVGEPRQLLPELELGLYRLVQEGLNNVRRHAQATQVNITLTYAENAVEVEIVDDGVGFEGPTDPSELLRLGRLGLMGMHERARLFGGRAMINSTPGEGTTVHVVIPLSTIVLPPMEARS
ncbi:MAG TPA: HAMP domain-containing protein [Chloroflexi bacterium]|nr:HAMP domain-containing protein [Chloroflexota bacterium]